MTLDFGPDANIKKNSRIIIGAGIILGIIFLVNATLATYLLRKSSIKDHEDQLSNLTVILAEHTAQTIFSANTALDSIVEAVKIAKIDNESAYVKFASQKNQFNILQEKTRANPILDVSTFVGKDGAVLNFSRSFPPPEINLSDRDYFKYLSTNNDLSTYYSVPVRNKGNGKWVFYLAKRINGTNDQFLGIILVGVSVEVFSSLYQRIGGSIGEGSAINLYRKDKTLLTRWPFVDDLIGKVNPNSLIDQSLNSISKNNGVIFTDSPGFARNNTEPVMRMISYRSVEGCPFIVGAVMPDSIYLENWHVNAGGVLIATGLSLLTLLLASIFLLKSYRRSAENQFRAHHDILTGLPNRSLFSDRLEHALRSSKRNQLHLAILFIDFDNMKTINDTYSHAAGDIILEQTAKRMQSCLREADTLARIGGDEFIVMLSGISNEIDAVRVAEKIQRSLDLPFNFEDHSIVVNVSIGIALYPDHGLNQIDLINSADHAMYQAKTSGGSCIKIYTN